MVYHNRARQHIRPMQANDSGNHPSRWRLPPEHLEKLTDALRAGRSRKSVTPEQRAVITNICSSAERWVYTPEDYLIAFKLAIVDAANISGIRAGPDRNDLLEKLVSVYIDEFYRSLGPAPTTPDSNGAREIASG
jgi:hypothetical protein